MNLQKQIAALAANIISVDCAAYQTGSSFSLFYLKKIVFAFMPLIAVAFPLVLLTLWAIASKACGRRVSFSSMRITLITAVIVVLFFILPMLTQQAFGMLSCIRLGVSSGDFFIVDNMVERCWSSSHIFYVLVVCVPMVVLYVLGIPLMSFRLLWINRAALHTPDIKRLFFFLYTGYEPEFWFWEYTIVTRKIVLVAISVFFQTSPQLQACTNSIKHDYSVVVDHFSLSLSQTSPCCSWSFVYFSTFALPHSFTTRPMCWSSFRSPFRS